MRLIKMSMVMLSLWAGMTLAKAEVLVILPQTGNMARAAESVKAGIEAVRQANQDTMPVMYVDANQIPIEDVFRRYVTAQTQLVIGPLDRQRVDQLNQLDLSVPVLALNHSTQQPKLDQPLYQFALAKYEDAARITEQMQQTGIQHVFVLEQAQVRQETASLLQPLQQLWGGQLQLVEQIPTELQADQALLLLGKQAWINQLKHVPKNNVYAFGYSIEKPKAYPDGLQVCDTPALYQRHWPEITQLMQQHSHVGYQRLVAFGADAWNIGQIILQQRAADMMQSHLPVQASVFVGRTGQIQVQRGLIQRQPICFVYQKKQFQPVQLKNVVK